MPYVYGFLIGVAGSLIASILLETGRTFWANFINAIFRRIYPRIAGKYRLTIPKELMDDPRERVVVILKQFGASITGTITGSIGEKVIETQSLHGKVSPSRYLMFTYDPVTSKHNRFGTGFYRVSSDAKRFVGFLSYICTNCEKTHAADSVLELIKDEDV